MTLKEQFKKETGEKVILHCRCHHYNSSYVEWLEKRATLVPELVYSLESAESLIGDKTKLILDRLRNELCEKLSTVIAKCRELMK